MLLNQVITICFHNDTTPAAASWGKGSIDVYNLGTSGDLIVKSFENGWFPSISLGGNIPVGVAVCACGVGCVDIFSPQTPDNVIMETQRSVWRKVHLVQLLNN